MVELEPQVHPCFTGRIPDEVGRQMIYLPGDTTSALSPFKEYLSRERSQLRC